MTRDENGILAKLGGFSSSNQQGEYHVWATSYRQWEYTNNRQQQLSIIKQDCARNQCSNIPFIPANLKQSFRTYKSSSIQIGKKQHPVCWFPQTIPEPWQGQVFGSQTAAYKLTCLGHSGQQQHQSPVLLVLLVLGLRPATKEENKKS